MHLDVAEPAPPPSRDGVPVLSRPTPLAPLGAPSVAREEPSRSFMGSSVNHRLAIAVTPIIHLPQHLPTNLPGFTDEG